MSLAVHPPSLLALPFRVTGRCAADVPGPSCCESKSRVGAGLRTCPAARIKDAQSRCQMCWGLRFDVAAARLGKQASATEQAGPAIHHRRARCNTRSRPCTPSTLQAACCLHFTTRQARRGLRVDEKRVVPSNLRPLTPLSAATTLNGSAGGRARGQAQEGHLVRASVTTALDAAQRAVEDELLALNRRAGGQGSLDSLLLLLPPTMTL